ncbi:MAG: 1-acyl-sn-glycerol-3-phosphate acyltransferase [Clostridiales bacterium]|nr:1-acyl-sn-glycerol-3-phosphate acyltransferase [Clostridiales bacterium]
MKNTPNVTLYKIIRPIFSLLFKLYYNPTILHKEYIPQKGSALVAGNHKHALDPIFVGVCTNRVLHSLAKKELHEGKMGFFFRAVGSIPVDLQAESNKEATASAIKVLSNGGLIGISPEAKRNYTKELLLPFKFGAVSMAKKSNSVIVPYAITGDYKFRSKNLKIVFGKAINVSNMNLEEANELLYKTVKILLLQSLEGKKEHGEYIQ